MSTAEVQKQQDLRNGYELGIQLGSKEANFTIYEPGGKQVRIINVHLPLQRESWLGEWNAERDDPEFGFVELAYSYSREHLTPKSATAVAEALCVAAVFCQNINDLVAERLAYQVDAQLTYERKVQEAEAAEQAKLEDLREQVQWYVGQNFKLTRKGYKAIVYGTINRVSASTIYTTSERGVPMETRLLDLEAMYIKYEGEKRYTKVFPH